MALKKSEKRLLGILGIVVFIFVMDTFVCKKGDDGKQANTPAMRSVKNIQKVTSQLTSKKAETTVAVLSRTHFESWGKDPFVLKEPNLALSKRNKVKKPNIQGIFEKEGRTYVLVDDAVIEEGSEKDGLRIVSIDGNRIIYSQKGRRYTLVWGETL